MAVYAFDDSKNKIDIGDRLKRDEQQIESLGHTDQELNNKIGALTRSEQARFVHFAENDRRHTQTFTINSTKYNNAVSILFMIGVKVANIEEVIIPVTIDMVTHRLLCDASGQLWYHYAVEVPGGAAGEGYHLDIELCRYGGDTTTVTAYKYTKNNGNETVTIMTTLGVWLRYAQ